MAFDEVRGFRRVGRLHDWAIPFELVANSRAQGDAAQKDDLGEIGGDAEIRVGSRASLHHGKPLLFHGEIRIQPAVAFSGSARDTLGNGNAGLMLITVNV